ncbi:MAG: DUF308 domain-containing protein [Lachnospiraceae bacterium]|nr:DUF308 domain-containing protein [Lachnospiraceae bacterium]
MFKRKKNAEEEFLEETEEQAATEVVKKQKSAIRISGLQIGFSFVFLVLGTLLLFVPQMTPVILCYCLAGGVMGIGVILIVRYFLSEAYQNIRRYGFSIGVILILCGSVILARTGAISEYLILAMGALMLAAAVFKLQNALDLRAIKDQYWWIWLLIAFLFAIFATVILVNPFSDQKSLSQFASVLVFIDGLVSLVGTFYLSFRLRSWEKNRDEAPLTVEAEPKQEHSTHPDPTEKSREEDRSGVRTPGIQEDFDEGID